MAQVTLRINGYAYTVGCRDGEEAHLTAMGREVEKRIETIKSGAGQSGEARMLVMAALLMADELYELEQRVQAGPSATQGGDAKLGRRLSRMAKRAEEIAAGLEAT
jgi:cell division protein ZapA